MARLRTWVTPTAEKRATGAIAGRGSPITFFADDLARKDSARTGHPDFDT